MQVTIDNVSVEIATKLGVTLGELLVLVVDGSDVPLEVLHHALGSPRTRFVDMTNKPILHAFHLTAELLPHALHLTAELGRCLRKIVLGGRAELGYRLLEIILGGWLAHAFMKLQEDVACSKTIDSLSRGNTNH